MTDRAALWNRLREHGLVAGEPPEVDVPSPWYVRALLGVAGWIAAFFLLGFIGVAASSVIENEAAAAVVGLLAIGAACALFVMTQGSTFASQIAFAISCCGQALVVFALSQGIDDFRASAFAIAVFEGVLAGIVPYSVHRFVSAAAAAIAASLGLAWSGAFHLPIGLLCWIVGWLWLNENTWAIRGAVVRPVAYGLTIALVAVQATWFGQEVMRTVMVDAGVPQWFPYWLGLALPAGALVAVTAGLLRDARQPLDSTLGRSAVAGAAAIGAVSLEAPGIAAAFVILLVGYSRGNVVLVGIGVTALLGYVSAYYYLLETSLLVKSATFVVTGIVLLVVRLMLRRLAPEGVHVDEVVA